MDPKIVKRAQLVAALENPMGELKRLLDEHPSSSNVIAERTGVASSVVRSVRNGQTGNMRTATWSVLMIWLLGEGRPNREHPTTMEELNGQREVAAA